MSAGQTGQMTGQMGHVHGRDGTQTRGCPAKILYVYSFFLFAYYQGHRPSNQGKTPWVAPACADCPGFLVLGSAPAPASTLVSELQIVPLG